MAHLTLSCFGPFQATLDGERLTSFHSIKVQALLAYLALGADSLHTREYLATLLWPLDAEASARNSLRQALYELRKVLGDNDSSPAPFLLVTRQSVQFNQHSDYTLDVADFLVHLKQGSLEVAVTLYRGELLSGLSCESEPFEGWLRLTREHFHNLVLDALFKLTQQALKQQEVEQARTYAQRQLALEPWREEAHRQLMTALALTGERSAALAQYESCRRILADELGVEPDKETTSLYEQIKAGKLRGQRQDSVPASGQPKAEPTTHQVQPVRHNLPAQLTPFVGRTTDLAQLAVRLHDPACRLLTIVGPGGMGKTRLAIQAAQPLVEGGGQGAEGVLASQEQPPFRDGVFFVALAGVAAPELLVSTISAALEFTFYGSADPKTQLLDYLRSRSVLIVLDNFEHLLDGAELVTHLLRVAPGVKVLTTSREPLNLHEEWLYPLGGMSFPGDEDDTSSGTITDLTQYTAVQLFIQCARRMQPAFDLAQEEEAVVRICWLVGGMPLGIEMASSWLKHFSCTQIAQEVEHSLDFLATSLRNVPARHRSMRAVFEHSWSLLSEAERQVLQRLAVFRGGFRLEAAQQVAEATFPLLISLAEKSLVQPTPSGRYQMHELLRQFVEEKLLTDSQRANQTYELLCAYYSTFLQQQEAHLKGRQQAEATSAIEMEIENIQTVWQWAVAHRQLESIDRSLETLLVFYDTKSWFQEGFTVFGLAADVLHMNEPTGRSGLLLGRVLARQGWMLAALDFNIAGATVRENARILCQRSLRIFEKLNERLETAIPLYCLASLALNSGDAEQARQLFHEALALFTEQNDAWKMTLTLYGLGMCNSLIGKYEQAMHDYNQAITLCKDKGDMKALGSMLNRLADTLRAMEEYEAAREVAHQALAVNRAADSKPELGWALKILGELALNMGDFATAQQYAAKSLDLFQEMGLTRTQDSPLVILGYAACGLGDYHQAKAHFHTVLRSHQQAGTLNTSWYVADAIAGLASVSAREGRTAQAMELLTLTLHHPAAWQETKDQGMALLAELVPETFSQTKPPVRSLEVVITELLNE